MAYTCIGRISDDDDHAVDGWQVVCLYGVRGRLRVRKRIFSNSAAQYSARNGQDEFPRQQRCGFLRRRTAGRSRISSACGESIKGEGRDRVRVRVRVRGVAGFHWDPADQGFRGKSAG